MQRKVASGNQAKCTPPKAGLATFYGIGYMSRNFILVVIYYATKYLPKILLSRKWNVTPKNIVE